MVLDFVRSMMSLFRLFGSVLESFCETRKKSEILLVASRVWTWLVGLKRYTDMVVVRGFYLCLWRIEGKK